MSQPIENKHNTLGPGAILIHLGLLVFGVTAWLTGPLADDYKRMSHLGFSIHSWLGMALAAFALFRLITGIIGPPGVRFRDWMPLSKERLSLAGEDIVGLTKMRLPDRATHQGLAGVVHTFGLIAFFFMAATGLYLFLFLEPGAKAHGLVHDVKELHEIGLVLIGIFLSLHVGAVIMHALHGNHLWKRIFFIS